MDRKILAQKACEVLRRKKPEVGKGLYFYRKYYLRGYKGWWRSCPSMSFHPFDVSWLRQAELNLLRDICVP